MIQELQSKKYKLWLSRNNLINTKILKLNYSLYQIYLN